MLRHIPRVFVLCGTLALAGCKLNDATAATVSSDPATETFAPALGVNIAQMKRTTDGTYYKDITVGTGPAMNVNNTTSVTVDYTLYLKDGSKVDAGTNATFGLNGVIYGFVDGINGMAAGGERLIVVPSFLGYGGASAGNGAIPPNSTLVFDVKLRAFQ